VQADDDIRLMRRIKRDIAERGREVRGVLKAYHRFVKPSYEQYIKPTMKRADIIVPRGRGKEHYEKHDFAISFIAQNLEYRLRE